MQAKPEKNIFLDIVYMYITLKNNSLEGNRTLVARVKCGNSNHYTTDDLHKYSSIPLYVMISTATLYINFVNVTEDLTHIIKFIKSK
jgi:hypothetical protein